MEQNKLYFRCLMLSSEKGKTRRKWKKKICRAWKIS